MSVGYANGIRVMSMTHTGEPGFMLYIPIEVSSTRGRCAGAPHLAEHWPAPRAVSDCALVVEQAALKKF